MANEFGFSNDAVAAFIAAAMKLQETKKGYRPDDPFRRKGASDVESEAKKSADTAKKFFDAHMAQGFSRQEAFELTKGNLNAKF